MGVRTLCIVLSVNSLFTFDYMYVFLLTYYTASQFLTHLKNVNIKKQEIVYEAI